MPGASARTSEIAKRMLFDDIHATDMSSAPQRGRSRRNPIQQEFPE
jgi:hypothetical protein